MKTKISIFFLFLGSLLYSQEKVYYLNADNNFKIVKTKDGKNVLQAYLLLKNNNDFDSYYFIIQTDFEDFDKSSKKLEFKDYVLLEKEFFKDINSCELHDFFSKNRNMYLVFEKDGVYFGWSISYESTSKNTIISVNRNSKI